MCKRVDDNDDVSLQCKREKKKDGRLVYRRGMITSILSPGRTESTMES